MLALCDLPASKDPFYAMTSIESSLEHHRVGGTVLKHGGCSPRPPG